VCRPCGGPPRAAVDTWRTLEEKIADVMRQLRRGEATVVLDPRTTTVNIVSTAGSRRA
jgi:uncharacterized protein YheU (UPF0270 family)